LIVAAILDCRFEFIMSTATIASTIRREPELLGHTVVVMAAALASASKRRAVPTPRELR
jgi:hypothetical protein